MAGSRFVSPYFWWSFPSGEPIPGALLDFFVSPGTTRATTYADVNLTTPNTNPVVADGDGVFPSIFLDPRTTYRVVLSYPSDGINPPVQIWSADPVLASYGSVLNYAALRADSSTISPVFVAGALVAGDGGQGWFFLDPNDTTSVDNGGTVIVSGSSRWYRQYTGGISPEWFGGFAADMTAALNAAFAVGGLINLAAVTYNYTGLAAQKTFRMVGALQANGVPQSLLNCTSAGAGDKIVVGTGVSQQDGNVFEHITFSSPNSTGGAIIFFTWVADTGVYDCQFLNLGSSDYGVKVNRANTIRFRDIRIVSPITSGIRVYGDDGTRSDGIDLQDVTISGDSTTAHTHLPTAIDLDGFVNDVTGRAVKGVNCGRGLWSHNTVGATQRGEFIFIYDMEFDFPYYEGILIDYHDTIRLTDLYVHGSITARNIVFNTASPNTTTDISIKGGQCTGAALAGMYLNGNYTRISNFKVTDNSLSATGTYPGILIGPNSVATIVTGNQIGDESGVAGPTQSYGVEVAAGAIQYVVANNDLTGNVLGPINNVQDDPNSTGIITPNIGMTVPDSFAAIAPATGSTVTIGPAGGQFDVCNLAINVGGTLAALTIQLPALPYNNQELHVFSNQIITALTVTPGAGQTIAAGLAPTAMVAGGSFVLKYAEPATTWYRLL